MQTSQKTLTMVALCVMSGAWAPIVSATVDRTAAGQNATEGQFPWQVSLIMDRTHFCSGALIAPNWVLTSAHCTQKYSSFIVSMGSLYPDSHAVEQTISHDKFVHPDFDADADANDVGLVKLSRNINFTDTISAVEIEGSAASFAGYSARVAGWGDPSAKLMDNLLPTLQWTETAVLDEQQCSEDLGLTIDDGHLCTSGTNKSGICAGDDGGGLVLNMNGHWRLVGVATSSSTGGCNTGTPSVYTRASKHAEWITSVTGIIVTATPTPSPSTASPLPSSASAAAWRFLLMGSVLGIWIWQMATSHVFNVL